MSQNKDIGLILQSDEGVWVCVFSITSLWEESRIKRERRRGAHTVLCTVGEVLGCPRTASGGQYIAAGYCVEMYDDAGKYPGGTVTRITMRRYGFRLERKMRKGTEQAKEEQKHGDVCIAFNRTLHRYDCPV